MKQRRRRLGRISACLFGLALPTLCGCMVGPNFVAPQTATPAQWTGIEKASATSQSRTTAGDADLTRWWLQFQDPVLTALVEEAVQTNLDLKIAEARLRQARALRGVAYGGLWPSVGASGGYQRVHKAGVPGVQDQFQSGLDAVWELDLFGGQRRILESADAGIAAADAGVRDAQVSLVAEVALDYIQLRGFQQEITIANDNLEAQQRTAAITHKQFATGFANALDVANAEATVAMTRAQIPVYETAERQAIYALGVLLSRSPSDLLSQLSSRASIPSVPALVPVALPSDLLRRRPDIKAAEAQLHAATAQVGVAVAEFFPSFSLTGAVNWNSNMLGSWWSGSSRSFGMGPSMNWPIFQGGAITANVRLQEALRDQSFLSYRKTVLAAFQDVENALIAFANEQQHRKSLGDAVASNRKAVDLSLRLYTEGMTDFLNVVTAERSLYAAEDSLVQSTISVATDLVALYKALGGGVPQPVER